MFIEAVNIHDSIRPLELLLKFLGMLPLFWSDDPTRKSQLLKKLLNYLYLVLNYTLAIAIANFYNESFDADATDWTALLQNNAITQTVVVAFPVVSITFGYMMANHYRNIFRDVQTIDCKVKCSRRNGTKNL